MKIFNIKITITAILLLVLIKATAQELETKKANKWYIPSSSILQYAGSIGFLSVGAGYYLNKSHKSTLDISYGYVPAKYGGDLNILAAKFAWRPFAIPIKDWAVIHPINSGVFLSYHAGGDFDSTCDDDEYPENYYWWSTAFRPHLSLATEVKLNAKKLKTNLNIKSISLYSELNTN